MKNIDITTEPAGYLSFGSLSKEQVEDLSHSLGKGEITDELFEIRYNSEGDLEECEGVFVTGAEGDQGNEGVISSDESLPSIGPERTGDGAFIDGIYVVNMRLSKCSISFEFDPGEDYKSSLLEEVSTAIELPNEIRHGTYGCLDCRVVTGYVYDEEEIEEAVEAELIDRGFDFHLMFFAIKNGKTSIIYSNFEGEEEWIDRNTGLNILSEFK